MVDYRHKIITLLILSYFPLSQGRLGALVLRLHVLPYSKEAFVDRKNCDKL